MEDIVRRGDGQLVMHGVTFNKALGTWYNSGLAAVVVGHLPLGIWYLVTICHSGRKHSA